MHLIMVKKRLADGSECRKCREVTQLLEERGFSDYIDEVVWADENDPESAGAKLAAEYDTERAPFFIVREGRETTLYTSALKLINKLDISQDPCFGVPSSTWKKIKGVADGFVETNEKVEASLEFLEWVMNRHPKIALANSFGKDSMVVYHLARRINPDVTCFSVLTRYKPRETFELKDYVEKAWNLKNFHVYMAPEDAAPDELYKTDPEACCHALKVKPIFQALEELEAEAWITGLRRTEGNTRTDFQPIEPYTRGIVKVNPILDWTELDIWKYTALHQIPVNPLYALGYRSLGCAPCSAPGGKYERSGRWQGTSKAGGECGIHTANKPDVPLNEISA